jgi:predicted MFS family arabinose efflux permease
MGLWLVQWGTGQLGMQPSEAMSSLAVPRILTTVTGAFFGSLFMGYISDKISRVSAVAFASGLAAVVYLSMFLVTDPTADWVFFLLGAMGVAEISAFVSSQALVGQQAPAHRRGAVIGFFGVSGAIGILIGTAGGGWLYRHVGPSAPFVLFGGLNFLVFVWALRVRRLPLSRSQPIQAADL